MLCNMRCHRVSYDRDPRLIRTKHHMLHIMMTIINQNSTTHRRHNTYRTIHRIHRPDPIINMNRNTRIINQNRILTRLHRKRKLLPGIKQVLHHSIDASFDFRLIRYFLGQISKFKINIFQYFLALIYSIQLEMKPTQIIRNRTSIWCQYL